MQVKYLRNNFAHLLCFSAIIWLSAFVIRAKLNGSEVFLQDEMISTLNKGTAIETRVNKRLVKIVKENHLFYPSEKRSSYFKYSKRIVADSDSLRFLLDSLGNHSNKQLAERVVEDLKIFREKIIGVFKIDDLHKKNIVPNLSTNSMSNYWFGYHKKRDQEEYSELALSYLKNKIAEMELLALRECQGSSSIHENYSDFMPYFSVTQIGPSVGETIVADIFFKEYDGKYRPMTFTLNGQELPSKEGVAHIKTRYPIPGKYPLHFAIEVTDQLTDSLHRYEKTYFLNVRE